MAAKDYARKIKRRLKRPHVHAKSRISNNKNSKLYKKKYRGQGK